MMLALALWMMMAGGQQPEAAYYITTCGNGMSISDCYIACRKPNGCTDAEIELVCPQAEPQDVPAIQETRKECVIPDDVSVCSAMAGSQCPCGSMKDVPYWTCADKSRILLTSEDGQHHCIKFGGGETHPPPRTSQ
jgi:hypothetical protein